MLKTTDLRVGYDPSAGCLAFTVGGYGRLGVVVARLEMEEWEEEIGRETFVRVHICMDGGFTDIYIVARLSC